MLLACKTKKYSNELPPGRGEVKPVGEVCVGILYESGSPVVRREHVTHTSEG